MRAVRVFLPMAFAVLSFGPSFAYAQPGQATLVSSADAGANTFTWNAVTGATYYYLWVNEGNTPKHQLWYTSAQAGCANGELTCRINVVLPNMNFVTGYWWIQTWSPAGYGPWSSPQTFEIRPPKPPIVVDANNRYIGTLSTGNALVDINGLPATLQLLNGGFNYGVPALYFTADDCTGQQYAQAVWPDRLFLTNSLANSYLARGAISQRTSRSSRTVFADGTLSPCAADDSVRTLVPITLLDLTSQFGSLTAPFKVIR